MSPVEGEYDERGYRKHEFDEKQPISDKEKQKREGLPAVCLAAVLVAGSCGVATGIIKGDYDKKQEELSNKILEKIAKSETRIEGMQMLNKSLGQIKDEKIKKAAEELIRIEEGLKGQKISSLTIETLVNVAFKSSQIKQEVLSYFINVLEEENLKEEKLEKKLKNNKYKDKIRETIKRLCRPVHNKDLERWEISGENFSVILKLTTCSDEDLRDWAKRQKNLVMGLPEK